MSHPIAERSRDLAQAIGPILLARLDSLGDNTAAVEDELTAQAALLLALSRWTARPLPQARADAAEGYAKELMVMIDELCGGGRA